MRVLFLDVDGVLHPAPCWRRMGGWGAQGTLVARDEYHAVGVLGWLDQLVELLQPHPDVRVVLHSSWRDSYSLEELRKMFSHLGRNVEITPAGGRHASIEAWLAENPASGWIILDGQADEFPEPPPAELILCDEMNGISDARVQGAVVSWLARSSATTRSQ